MRVSALVIFAAFALSACGSDEPVEETAPAGDVEASAEATMEAALAAGDAAEEEVDAAAEETSAAVDDALEAAESRTDEIAEETESE